MIALHSGSRADTLRSLIAENRPVGFVRWWQELSNCCLAGLSEACLSMYDTVMSKVGPITEHEARLLAHWEGVLFEHLGLSSHIALKSQDAEFLYERSSRAYQRFLKVDDLQRLTTLKWLLKSSHSILGSYKDCLDGYLNESLASIEVITPKTIFNIFLEADDWQVRRATLTGISKLGDGTAILAALEHSNLCVKRDAITVALESRIFPPTDWLIQHICDEQEDWYIQLSSARLLRLMPVGGEEIRDDVWNRLSWTANELVRAEVILALGRWNPTIARKIIPEMLGNDFSFDVYRALCQVIMDIGDPGFTRLVESSTYNHRDLLERKPALIQVKCLNELKRPT